MTSSQTRAAVLPPEWHDRALCAETDPEAFFPEKGGSTREAKQVCRGCEVSAECLEYALERDERFGIWGGLSERERRRLKREPLSVACLGTFQSPRPGACDHPEATPGRAHPEGRSHIMPANPRPLDLTVLRNGRPADTFQATGDPEDHPWLESELRGWLIGRKWNGAHWSQFELVAREAGRARIFAKVRA